MPRLSQRLLAGLVLAALVAGSAPAWAQRTTPANDEASSATSFLTPFPEADIYRVQVYGDGYAEGLLGGLTEALGNETRLAVQKRHKPIGALIRPEWEEDLKPEETARDLVHIAVIMLGLSDRQIIRPAPNTKAYPIGSDEWQAEYGRRLDRWLKTLKKRNIAVYLVGQPVLRRSDAQTHAEMINEIMREKAYLNGMRFIDIMEAFQDENGGFSQFGPDLSGNRQKLRDGDGVTFTSVGNRKLAHFVEREMKRDVQQAATDRTVPLAGNEAEQRRVNPTKAAAPVTGGWKGSVTVGGAKGASAQQPAPQPAIADGVNDQKADNARIALKTIAANGREETIAIDIVRPAIPATVIALLTRKNAAERLAQPADTLVEDFGNGLTLMNAVSSLGDVGTPGSAQRRKTAATQTPYFAVLVKGERLPPKPGRADDFVWPRIEPAVPAPAAAPIATPPPPQAQAPKATPGPAQPAKAKAQQR